MTEITAQTQWKRTGLVLARNAEGYGAHVVGDPCVVWDSELSAWRMVLFYDRPGHGTSISHDPSAAPGTWATPTPLDFTNPELLPAGGGTHKPFIVSDAHEPNQASFVDGRYWLVTVSFTGNSREKRVQRAWSTSLAGPWTLEPEELISRGAPGAFDENHVDAVSGYWLEETGEFIYYYMGYPLQPQPWAHSPYGNAIGVVTQKPGGRTVAHGVMLNPSDTEGHWASGYLGGFQLLDGSHPAMKPLAAGHRWVAVLNASPTPPRRDGELTSEEPAPSLGGLAFSDADSPVEGWELAPEPFEWIEQIPADAIAAGEGVNLWRQHLIVTPDATRLLYNSGFYGEEQMYSKLLRCPEVARQVPGRSLKRDPAFTPVGLRS
ncbi:hypothetical protein ACRAWC_09245 [Leifsonia sp. L25]|uniref:hypothetical protein n=1 Tax=Actinomycetes TaxID=1760 RepID=UPI003D69079D